MTTEWNQICKDCGKKFGYSDTSLQRELNKGLSRPERCQTCRGTHAQAIKTIASSHFELKSRVTKASILGYPFLGMIDHEERKAAEPKYLEPNMKGIDIGLKESHILQVYEALKYHQVVVVMAPTGSGKSTYIPSKLLYPLRPKEIDFYTRNGPIIITQPRIAATIQIPNAIGKRFGGCSVDSGFDIGYCFSKDKEKYDLKRNRMVFTTDGSLINWIADGRLGEFSMVVIDEAHERSYNIESIINMVYRELLKYPKLKLMIISATIDAASFEAFFSKTTNVKILDFSDCEKTFGYEAMDKWGWDDLAEKDFEEKIYQANKAAGDEFLNKYKATVANRLADKIIDIVRNSDSGGILGFLDGKENINKAIDRIREKLGENDKLRVYPFHRDLSDAEMIEVLTPKFKGRRIIIATNSAETSLTFDDLVYVVDSGIIKEESWNSSTCRKGLDTKFHSKAGCKQRWGRAGRVRRGFVAKLYSKEEFINYFPNYTIPAIQRSNSEPLILDAVASGQSDIDNFNMLTRPNDVEWKRALSVIKGRGLLDKDGDFTSDGLEIYELSKAVSYTIGNAKAEYNSTDRSLDIACLLLLADKFSCLIEAATMICMMPHMGNALYWAEDGLFKWSKRYNLISMDYQFRLLESLKAGCTDDLDFSCKLFSLFEGELFKKKLSTQHHKWFLKEYAVNERCFESIAQMRGQLLGKFTKGKKTDTYRKLDLKLLNRVRILVSLAWNNKIVTVREEEEILFENAKDNIVGAISSNCAGNWKKGDQAILGIMDQNEIFATVADKRIRVPVANFLLRLLTPLPKNETFDIVKAFHIREKILNVETMSHELESDFVLPINTKVKLDTFLKDGLILGSFGTNGSNTQSEDAGDLFIMVFHKDGENINPNNYITDRGSERSNDQLMIEKWTNNNGKTIAKLTRIPLTGLNYFSKLENGDKVKAFVLRPVFNIRGIGFKGIVGYIVAIEGFHYALPVDNLFIEFVEDTLQEIIGKEIVLTKIGETPELKHPIFSRIPEIEVERNKNGNFTEVTGKIVKKSNKEILCRIGESLHFISISLANIGDDRKFLQLEGDLRISLLRKNTSEQNAVDCLNNNLLDYTEDDKKTIRTLLSQCSSDNRQLKLFTKCGIEIKGTKLTSTTELAFQGIVGLSFAYPLLAEPLRYLHKKSWEIKGEIKTIQRKIDQAAKGIEAKNKLQENILKNRASKENAEAALIRFTRHGNYEKINSIREQIDRLEGWINDGEDRLKSWKD